MWMVGKEQMINNCHIARWISSKLGHYAECRHAECHYAECHGADLCVSISMVDEGCETIKNL